MGLFLKTNKLGKSKVGGKPVSARGGLNSWSFASATGPRKITFEAWYKPHGSY